MRWKKLTEMIVVFIDSVKRGFNVHHLTPNGVLFLSLFISFCENFVGMEPHWAFFHQSFVVRRQVPNDPNQKAAGTSMIKVQDKTLSSSNIPIGRRNGSMSGIVPL
jgi:hypothetical protein